MRKEFIRLVLILFIVAGIGELIFPNYHSIFKILIELLIVLLSFFIEGTKKPNETLQEKKSVNMAVKPPKYFVQRPKELDQITRTILRKPSKSTVSVTSKLKNGRRKPESIVVALVGGGGCGKTMLAQKVCWEPKVKNVYRRVLWVTLGEERLSEEKLVEKIKTIIYRVTDTCYDYPSLQAASDHLHEIINKKGTLFVIDDVWREEDLKPFLQYESECTYLVTTQNKALVSTEFRKINVNSMQTKEAIELLGAKCDGKSEIELKELAEELYNWPLLLCLANRQLRDDVIHQKDLNVAISKVKVKFRSQGIIAFDEDSNQRDNAVSCCIKASLNGLDERQYKMFQDLAVFPEDEDIPLQAVEVLLSNYGVDGQEVEDFCRLLDNLNLINKCDLHKGEIRLRDVIRKYLLDTYLAERNEQINKIHERFLDIYLSRCKGNWVYGSEDKYYYNHLVYHMVHAKYGEDLYLLLTNYEWIKTRLKQGINNLLQDYSEQELLSKEHQDIIKVIKEAICLSSHVLIEDPEQLAPQLQARLLDCPQKDIQKMLTQIEKFDAVPRFRPFFPCLPTPGGPEIRTLIGHNSKIICLFITKDGEKLISCSLDNTIKIWDLNTGQVVQNLEIGRTNKQVYSAIVIDNGNKVICYYQNGNFTVWDLNTRNESQPFRRNSCPVDALASTSEGTRIVTTSNENGMTIITLWDTSNLREISHKPLGINDSTSLIAACSSKNQFVCTFNERFYIQNLNENNPRDFFKGETRDITCLSYDGNYVFSGYIDGQVRVWDTRSGNLVWEFNQHHSKVNEIVPMVDNYVAISCSSNGTLAEWNFRDKHVDPLIKGSSGEITTISLNHIQGSVISGFSNGTIKIWNLKNEQPKRVSDGHASSINSLAIDGAGGKAISGSSDKTIKLWKIECGNNTHTFTEHSGAVLTVTIDKMGHYGISGSEDRTIKFWDLETGKLDDSHNQVVTDAIQSLIFQDDEKSIVSGFSDGTVIFQDISTHNGSLQLGATRTYKLNSGIIQLLAVTPDGNRLIAVTSDKRLKFWDLHKGPSAFMLDQDLDVTALAITQDGCIGVSGYKDGSLRLWDLESQLKPRMLEELNLYPHYPNMIHKVTISSISTLDSRFIITGISDFIDVWNLSPQQYSMGFSCEHCMRFYCNSKVNALSLARRESALLVGDTGGSIYYLQMLGLRPPLDRGAKTIPVPSH